MPAEQGPIGENAIASDLAIVGHMAAGHEEVVVRNPRHHGLGRRPVDGNVLAEGIIVADFHAGRFISIAKMLRPLADDRVGKYLVVGAHGQRPNEMRARPDDAAGTEFDRAFDDDKGFDAHICPNFRLRRYQSRRVNPCRWMNGHGQPRGGKTLSPIFHPRGIPQICKNR